MIAPAEEKTFYQFGNAGFFLSGKLASEGKRFLAQMQVNTLYAHAHKLSIVGLCVKSHRGRETLKEKLKPYLQTGGWSVQIYGDVPFFKQHSYELSFLHLFIMVVSLIGAPIVQ